MINLPLIQVIDFLRSLYRFRWAAFLTACLVCALGWAAVWLMPNNYEAKSQIYVDTDTVLKPLLKGLTVETNDQARINSMTQVLLSRPNLEKVALKANLDLATDAEDDFIGLLDRLKRKIKIKREKKSRDNNYNIYEISYVDEDPNIAFTVVDSLLNALVESSIEGTKEDTESAQKFLEKQIAEYEEKLTHAEKTVSRF